MRNDQSLPMADYSDPEKLWESVRSSLREKADHNKIESQLCFYSSIIFSLTAPLFIAFGEGIFWGKIVPAVFSALVAATTAWLQLRQPQRLWVIYRRAQRELEDEKIRHDNNLSDYSTSENKEKLLVERTADITISLHDRWEALVPDGAKLGRLARQQDMDEK